MKRYGWLLTGILLIVPLIVLTGCDDDDVTGPDPTETPVPNTPTPEPSPDPSPTPSSAYQGGWFGYFKMTYPTPCPDERIWFTVSDDAVTDGHAVMWVVNFYSHEKHRIPVEFEGQITDGTFRVNHWEGSYSSGFKSWHITGEFTSPDTVTGSWDYETGALGESGDDGRGYWFARKITD
jgi:hypothetical protein